MITEFRQQVHLEELIHSGLIKQLLVMGMDSRKREFLEGKIIKK